MSKQSMVEKVARTLEKQAWAALGCGDTLAYQNRRTSSLRKARIAIEAMREMGENSGPNYTAGLYGRANIEAFVEDCLRDAALKEG